MNKTKSAIFENKQLLIFISFLSVIWLFSLNGSINTSTPHYEINEVDLDQAKSLLDNGALVIDVRNEDAFDARHIPGAVLIPISILRAGIPEFLLEAKDKPVMIYCNKGALKGPEGTHILTQAGFSQAVNIKSGIEGWADAGLPIEKGQSKL